MSETKTRTVVFHPVSPDRKITFRAWFAQGGYQDFETDEQARSAFSPMRGQVVRVDEIVQSTLWVADNKEAGAS